MYIAVGLGNPGMEYEGTRHNIGRMALSYAKNHLSDLVLKKIKIIEPDTYINQSGKFVAKVLSKSRHPKGSGSRPQTSGKAAEKLVVIYDDLDLPLGMMKVSYNRGSGGHKGLESIIKALKTKEFTRVRIGISPTAPKGSAGQRIKKPKTEKDVEKFILGEFKKSEMETLKKVFKTATKALEVIVTDGPYSAMNKFN